MNKKNEESYGSTEKPPTSGGRTLVNIGDLTGIKYSKEGDPEGFLRLRIVGKKAINGILCQVTGYVTQIKNEETKSGEKTSLLSTQTGDNK